MRFDAKSLLVVILGGCLLLTASCTDDTPAAPTPEETPRIVPGAPVPEGTAKEPFDLERLPVAIDVVGSPDELPPAPPLATPQVPGDAYAAAFEGAPQGTTYRGFEVAGFLLPSGMALLRFDVNQVGEAAWFIGADEQPTHVARVRRCASPAAAQAALREALSGYQQRLESYAIGELGFAAIRDGQPFRILFVRGNLLLQAWSLEGGLCDVLALALDTHARGGPVDDGSAPASLRIDVAQPLRAGTPAELTLGYEGTPVATSYRASGSAWVDTRDGQAWLLAPRRGEVTLSASAFDGWLRRSDTTLRVLVQD